MKSPREILNGASTSTSLALMFSLPLSLSQVRPDSPHSRQAAG